MILRPLFLTGGSCGFFLTKLNGSCDRFSCGAHCDEALRSSACQGSEG